MIACTDNFKKMISGNIRYLKATLVQGENETEISSFTMKQGGFGSEQMKFGVCYVASATIIVSEIKNIPRNTNVKIKIYVADAAEKTKEECNIANLYVYECVKRGQKTTITAYGFLYGQDSVLTLEGEEISFKALIEAIQEITGKKVKIIAPGGSSELPEYIQNNLTIKQISEPTVRNCLAKMAEMVMGYAYENAEGDFVICHGFPVAETTGEETNTFEAEITGSFAPETITCVVSEAYTGEDDTPVAAKIHRKINLSGKDQIKYRGYTTTEEQFAALVEDVIKASWKTGTATIFGNPLLEPCDALEIVDGNGDRHLIICAGEITHSFDGGLTTTITVPEPMDISEQDEEDQQYAEVETRKVLWDKVNTLEAEAVRTDTLDATLANLKYVKSDEIESIVARFGYAKVNELDVVRQDVEELYGDYSEFVKSTVEKFEADEAKIKKLDTDKLDATEAKLKYANIDFSNINKTAIEYFFAESGLIKNVSIGDATISGEIVGVTFKGDLIEGGTIAAEKLVIKGEDGLFYKLNVDALGETTASKDEKYQSGLDGSVLIKKSIAAEKIDVKDLVAFGATIGGFTIDLHAIFSGVKNAATNSTRGIYMGDDGQFAVGDSEKFIRYYKDQNGEFHLAITAGEILISSGKNLDTVLESLEKATGDMQKKIELIVASGSAESSLTLTENAIAAITRQFKVTGTDGTEVVVENGKLKCDDLSAISAKIAGFKISDGYLSNITDRIMYFVSGLQNMTIETLQNMTAAEIESEMHEGDIYIGQDQIAFGDRFYVRKDGVLHAKDAEIEGSIKNSEIEVTEGYQLTHSTETKNGKIIFRTNETKSAYISGKSYLKDHGGEADKWGLRIGSKGPLTLYTDYGIGVGKYYDDAEGAVFTNGVTAGISIGRSAIYFTNGLMTTNMGNHGVFCKSGHIDIPEGNSYQTLEDDTATALSHLIITTQRCLKTNGITIEVQAISEGKIELYCVNNSGKAQTKVPVYYTIFS